MRLAIAAALLVLTAGEAGAAEPSFADFPAGPIYSGRSAAPDLSDPLVKQFRTRVRDATREPVNFAGHFVLERFGCGTGCAMGFALDKRTGHVTLVPAVCCTAIFPPDGNLIIGLIDSRLLILWGELNETAPDTKHFYDFDGHQFKLIGTYPIMDASKSGLAAAPSDCTSISSDIARLDCFDRASRQAK